MSAVIIDGKKIAEDIRHEIKLETEKLKIEKGIIPGLAFILVGENPSSQSYVKMKGKGCDEMGFYSITEKLPTDVSEENVLQLINQFNHDPKIHGILVQLPLPKHISEEKIVAAIDYRKDVDGFHPLNLGRLMIGLPCFKPCTPAGIQELLIRSGTDPAGKHVVVVGRSNIVGKPVANIFLQKQIGANAVVTITHTGAKDISLFTKQADILIAAIGKAESITGDMVKRGAVIIDVGINRIEDNSVKSGYRIVGDVHFESAAKVAGAITPVPGGVGPMTIAMVLRNTLFSAQNKIYKL
ncbi:MAG: bifunctional 5,10-methylene-tetrahydrofolate dehydrogenase/5,10-methylene-tetrahydrofolate cyclohydrolase [Ignavibacteriales bacterium]|nr:bifunctional 5,10-methylene-tetrahydrofolate dehydrogenase/5,10-methylene-tetrahydrofolate cyclohydrolase [Ignavibacteriales bacterium]